MEIRNADNNTPVHPREMDVEIIMIVFKGFVRQLVIEVLGSCH